MDPVTRPSPPSAADRARWLWQSRRHRLTCGEWDEDGERRLHEFFNDAVLALLPSVEKSCNPFNSLNVQTSTLYDDVPAVHTKVVHDLATLGLPRLWAQQQETLLFVRAMHDALVRLDWDTPRGQVKYRLAPADHVIAWAHADAPSVPVAVSELRMRSGRWTWETWDPTNMLGRGTFYIEEEDANGVRVDVTAEFYTPREGVEAGDHPYYDKAGKPILPYQMYHSRITQDLWSKPLGEELVHGTLTAAALRTFWLSGVRDGGHPQRAITDGEIVGSSVVGNGTKGSGVVGIAPQHILRVRGTKEGVAPTLTQWDALMNPETAGKAIADFVAGLMTDAGFSPADATVSSAGLSRTSGVAIVVSREGQRKARKRIIPPMRQGDQELLALAARLSNGVTGGSLPEEPEDYTIEYADLPKSAAEIGAEIDNLVKWREAGAVSRLDIIRAAHPHLDEDGAKKKRNEIDEIEEPAEGGAAAPAAPTGPDGAPVENKQVTALNGAQVIAAQQIVTAVATRQLPRKSAVEMLINFFTLPRKAAEDILGDVGKTFFVEVTSGNGPGPAGPGGNLSPGGNPSPDPFADEPAADAA